MLLKPILHDAVKEWGDKADVRIFLFETLSQIHNARVLEVGCGKDYLLAALPRSSQGYGIDVDSKKLAQARKNAPRAVFTNASMYNIPFKKGHFDVVVCANALPGVDFPIAGSEGKRRKLRNKALSELNRVLKKEGTLLLTTPNGSYGKWPGKIKLEELSKLLKEAGFSAKIMGWNPFPPLLPPSRVLVKMPGWFSLLKHLTRNKIAMGKSKFFYVEARKL